ncbi:MAG: GAF domain-containing protein [Ilumatobacteraceae bacterium]
MTDTTPDDVELDVALGDDRATVWVRGEITALTSPTLAGVLNLLVDSGRHSLSVDLSDTSYVHPSAVSALASVATRLSQVGGTIAIRSAPQSVREMLDASNVSNLIVYESSDGPSASLRPMEQGDGSLAATTDPAAAVPVVAPRPLVRSSTDVIDAALRLVTSLADATVDNADGVSITLERHGRLVTVAASNDKVLTMDRHQYESGEGPCLAAKADGRWYYIESLADETRWPTFVPLALEQGIHSILSSPLMTNDRPQGALNIYSSKQRAFGTHQQELAALFAEQASEILTTAGSDKTDDESNQRFAEALATRRTIHQAQGMIMARDNLTADDAIGFLMRAARAAGVTVLSYATDLVTATPNNGQQR